MPDIKLDFSRVTYSGVLEIAAPIVPGSIIAFGILTLNPQLAAKLLSNPYLGYKSRIAAAILLSYIAGLLLNLLINYIGYYAGFLFGKAFGKKLFPNPPTPWRNLHWRRMARTFLGDDLAPSTDDLYFKEMHEAEAKKAEQIQDPQQKAAQQKFVQDFFLPKSIADNEWYWWYEVLSKYFTVEQWWAPPWQYFLAMVNTASWAVVLLMVFIHRHHWFAWVLCTAGVFFGTIAVWFTGGVFGDPYGVNQTAMLLRIIKPHPAKVTEG
jgi:hypothetical protein